MNTKLIPNSVKSWVSNRIKRVASQVQPPLHALKYIPYHQDASSYLLEKNLELKAETVDNGLPVPPDNLWLTYGTHIDEYLSSGKIHVSKMLELVMSSGFSLPEGSQILDFGCGAGRMIPPFKYLTDKCRIWGTDISAPHIMWAKQYLNPPFHFALTTTIPHLPFEDRSFRFIYCVRFLRTSRIHGNMVK